MISRLRAAISRIGSTTSLSMNVFANYAGQIYAALSNILIVTVYLRYMGKESYGLIAFFALLQAWFQVLDLGISPTLAREVARFRAGVLEVLDLRRLLRAAELLFICIATLGVTAMIGASSAIAHRWLKVERLPLDQVTLALRIMAVNIAIRWVSSVYRSTVAGFEEQVWLNGFGILVATARTFLMIPLFHLATVSVVTFSIYQVSVSAIEAAALVAKVYRLIPAARTATGWSLRPVWSVLPFSMSVAFSALVWVFVTQTDKLVLSKIFTLPEFAVFTFGVLAASVVNLIGAPVTTALLPRIAKLSAEGDDVRLFALYRRATRWVCVATAPTTLTLVVCAKPILRAWTGDPITVESAQPVLCLYAIGNGLLAVEAFQYYLQYARGNLRLHVLGNAGFIIVLVPLLVWAATRWRGVGAGYVWAGQCAFFVLFWTWVVHARFAPGLHFRWLFGDVMPIWGAVGVAATALVPLPLDMLRSRWAIITSAAACGALLLSVGVAANRDTWVYLARWWHGRGRTSGPLSPA